MLELSFADGSFDLIWSEGALYIMGVVRALQALHPLISSGGFLAFTELTWLTDDLPAEVLSFWGDGYPAMQDIAGNLALAEECGFEEVGHLTLPPEAWEEYYYQPLEKRLPFFLAAHQDDAAAREAVEILNAEIAMYRRYPESYGYVFYLLRKP